jgi:amino acid transporter
VEAIISLDPALAHYRVVMCLGLILVMTLANLRGLRESGGLFAPPTYLYIFMVTLLLAVAAWKGLHGSLGVVPHSGRAFEQLKSENLEHIVGGRLTMFVLLKGFSSGAVALTGVEAISNGVPAFRRPEAKNAANTMVWMGVILGSLFFGTAVLAHHLEPFPSEKKTAIAQMGEVVFGKGFLFFVLQIATCAILTLAANTAYADFPRLAQLIARDGYLPRQFANFGDRLVFSNGILVLALASSALIVVFGGVTTALIPLYAVGVFTAFTLSQTGMVRHHFKERQPRWQLGAAVNATGALSTLIVVLIVASTKFTSGAWIPIVIIPPVMLLFLRIKRHYEQVALALELPSRRAVKSEVNHTVVVLVGRMHRGVLKALDYAHSLRPQHLLAVSIASDEANAERVQKEWRDFGIQVPLEIVASPYRELTAPIKRFIEELDERWANDTITVVIPEFVVTHWYQQALHNQTALRLKASLLFREGIVVTSVPYLVHGNEASTHIAELRERELAR